MYFIKNKKLFSLTDDGTYEQFATVAQEIFLTADSVKGLYSYNDYITAVSAPLSKRVARVSLLYEDEVFRRDVSEYLLDCSIDIKYTQGLTRTADLSFINKNNMWSPDPINSCLWVGTKFKIEAGLYYNGIVFWNQAGIYVSGNPTVSDKDYTVQVPCYDKYALLDGTISGIIDSDFKIMRGTSVRNAIEMCLLAEQDNGKVYDTKSVIFNTPRVFETLPYTISQSPGVTYGEIIKELASMVFCDVYYNEYGHLTVSGDEDTNPFESRATLWYFDDSTFLYEKPNITINFSNLVNKVTVFGAIENGYRYKGIAINSEAKSRANIYLTNPRTEFIEDTNIVGDENCLGRARYELKKKTLIGMQFGFQCVFIPSLTPNNLVAWTSKKHGYNNEKFFINSVSYSLSEQDFMNLSLTNIREIPI